VKTCSLFFSAVFTLLRAGLSGSPLSMMSRVTGSSVCHVTSIVCVMWSPSGVSPIPAVANKLSAG